ncbi:MAG: hypothetical protein JW818_23665 [Pirellulales bacterium]|nr:hypothetical protein [Pirellulales bacterium]
MEELQKQVRRAAWRLGVQRFVTALGWCWTGALALAAGLILLGKFWPLGVADWIWVAAAGVLGLVAALGWAMLRGRGPVEAAIEIDRRFGLKERVSSTLALSDEERETEVGRALTADAIRRVQRINVNERMKVTPGRPLLYPIVPVVAALLIALLVSPVVVDNPAVAKAKNEQLEKKKIDRSVKKLTRNLAKQREKAKELGLKEAEDILKLLEKSAQDMKKNTPSDPRKAMSKINDLADTIKKRQEQAGGAKGLQEKLRGLKNSQKGPGDKFVDAVKKGNFEKAMKELKDLRDQMANGKLDKKQQQQLANQIDKMQNKLQEMVDAQKQAEKQLQNEIKKAQDAGDAGKANKLQEQLAQLQQQGPQMQQMQQLAKQLQNCSNCMKNGQMQGAADAMKQLEGQLADLQQQLDEMQLLDDAMDQLSQCRQGMCNGGKPGPGQGDGKEPMIGPGLGKGPGGGMRPEQAGDTKFRDAQTKQQVDKGSLVYAGEAHGPNSKGQVAQAIREQTEAAKHESADPLTQQRLPKEYRQSVGQYFKTLGGTGE